MTPPTYERPLRSPDAKKIVMDHLASALKVEVFSCRPDGEGAPERFLTVIATGGSGVTQKALTVAQVTVDAYGRSTGDAMGLARAAVDAIHLLPNQRIGVTHVQSTMPAEMPDPDTAQPRATCTATITLHR
nr:MAG TPA: tail completion protein [Caudoviricetes sp.]